MAVHYQLKISQLAFFVHRQMCPHRMGLYKLSMSVRTESPEVNIVCI